MKDRGKMKLLPIRKLCVFIEEKSVILITTFFYVGSVFANPVLDNIDHGNVTVVKQTSQQAISNSQPFNINEHEATHFQQPAGGVALNRINPQQGPASIYGSLSSTGTAIYPLNDTIIANSGSTSIPGAINDDVNLTLNSSGITNTNPIGSITAANNGLNLTSGVTSIETSSSQTYGDTVALTTNTNFISSDASTKIIAFNNDISGNVQPILTGTTGTNNFLINAPLSLTRLTVTTQAGTSNNNFCLTKGNNQNWIVTNDNAGPVTTNGLSETFNNIQNLTGGNNGNTLTFADNTRLSGNINGSAANTNTLDYSNYNSQLSVVFSDNANTIDI